VAAVRALSMSGRVSAPIPAYTRPIWSNTLDTLFTDSDSTRIEFCFFSPTSTTPFLALIPIPHSPFLTASNA